MIGAVLPSFCVICYSLVLYYSCVQSKPICGIVAGGVFPHPPAVAQLCTLLPPPGCFRGPFVAVDLLMDVFSKIQLPETGEIYQRSHYKRPEVYCVLSRGIPPTFFFLAAAAFQVHIWSKCTASIQTASSHYFWRYNNHPPYYAACPL